MTYKTHIHKILFFFIVITLGACSSKPVLEADAVEPEKALPENMPSNGIAKNNDPWEGFNRRSYYFNAKADQYVILPVVNGYQWITPDIMQDGVTNFFSNLGEINTFFNSVLQFKGERALITTGRFITNTTVGVLGLWDPATHLGMYKEKEDFGQTLGHWGVGSGPYFVIPLLGPSSVRDGTGIVVDSLVTSAVIDQLGMKWQEELALNVLKAIDTRKNVAFRYYGSGSAFEYELIRFLYFRKREIEVQR